MDGILLPILGALVSGVLAFGCLIVRRLRRFLLAALVSPFLSSVVLLLGGFILQDMNPAREYGAAYIPTGREHDPTSWDHVFCWSATIVSFAASAVLAYGAQRLGLKLLQDATADRPFGTWLSERNWFGFIQ